MVKPKLRTNSLTHAPFDSAGNLEHYAPSRSPYYTQVGTDWRPNDPMELIITVDAVRSGRSAKYLIWTGVDGTTYPMFITDLVDMLREVTITGGVLHGMFKVRKRGQNYGLCYEGSVSGE